MPYTLMKGLFWILAAGAIGLVVGWLLRSVAAKRQIDRARETRLGTSEQEELMRLRSRVANLEPVVNERDRLRAELDSTRRERASAAAPVTVAPVVADVAPAEIAPVVSEVASVPDMSDPSDALAFAPSDDAMIGGAVIGGSDVDVTAAAAVIGKRVDLDDLTVIEGIGPKIAELCQGIGIRTWSDLAETEVSLLRTMLTDAGQRFKAHDPTTWPHQARLLATGAWAEFRALTDRLDGGRSVD